ALEHAALDDLLGLELLEPLRQKTVGEVGHEVPDLGEAQRAVEKDEQDCPRPALADELHGAVIQRTTLAAPAYPLLFGPRNLLGFSCRTGDHDQILEGQAAC